MKPLPARRSLRTAPIGLGVGVVLAVTFIALAFLASTAGPGASATGGQSDVEIAIDTDPSGNTATSLGSVDTCRQLPTGDFQIDVIVDRIPADRDLVGLQFVIRFDSTKLEFKSAKMDFILSSTGGSPFPGNGNPVDMGFDPDDPNRKIWFFGAVQLGGGPIADVAGVAARVTFTALAGGSSAIEVLPLSPTDPGFQTKVINADNTLIPISRMAGGTIAVSPSTCAAAPPAPVHTPVHTPVPSPVPGQTPGTTPGPPLNQTPLPGQTPGTTPGPAPNQTPLPPAEATAAARATAEATATPGAETPGPSSDDDDNLVIVISIVVLTVLAATAGAAWVLRERFRRRGGPSGPKTE